MTHPRWTLRTFAPALLAALALSAPAAAQDMPWGKKAPATKKAAPPAKKQARKPARKAPAKKAPAKKAPATKAPPAKPAAKTPAAKVTAPSEAAPPAENTTAPAVAPAAKSDAAPTDVASGVEALLAPLGNWEDDPDYGRVWIPHEKTVGSQFAPYRTNGHWAVTDKGDWAWVSDFDWGNVPFHYGRWTWKKDKNWMWVPGDEYAPAWVVWRTGDAGYDFVGWAPMAPAPKQVEGEEEPRRRVLPFFFTPTAKLFSPNLDRHVVRDRSLGAQIQQHSEIFGGHVDRSSPGTLKAASPTFGQVRVPPAAIPRSRLASDAEAIAPVTLASLQAMLAPPAPQPPEAPTDAKASSPQAGPEETPQVRQFATPPAPEARFATPPEAESKPEARYRCWWTNSRPRIWRCGY